MIVFDLKCSGAGHVFEAWFGSSAAFDDQSARGLLACPICGDSQIMKALMTPNVSAKGNRRTEIASVPVAKPAEPSAAELKKMLANMAKAQTAALAESTWVGGDFANKARAMDAGEVDKTSIHGQATVQEAKALIEEGIAVLPLPFPVIPPDQCN